MKPKIPKSLRIWFIVHCVVDLLIGLPFLFFPEQTLTVVGLEHESLLLARLVGAALVGIGLVSLTTHRAGSESYHALLMLKLFWSSSAVIALMISIWAGAPIAAWPALIIFLFFFTVWEYYYKQLFSKK